MREGARAEAASDPRFPVYALSLAVFFSLVGVFGIAWSATSANALLTEAKNRYGEVQRYYGEILLFDEMLTMSARQAVAEGLLEVTQGEGDQGYWAHRYLETEQQLSRSLEALEALLGRTPQLRELVTNTSDANQKLIEMERRALAASTREALLVARGELSGQAYERLKAQYRGEMDDLMERVQMRFTADIHGQTLWVDATWVGAVVIAVLLSVFWFWALRALLAWRRAVLEARRESERARVALDDAIQAAELGVFRVYEDDTVELSVRCRRLLAAQTGPGAGLAGLLSGLLPEQRSEVEALMRASLQAERPDGGAVPTAVRVQLQGSSRWADVSWRAGQAEGRRALFGIVRDATEDQRRAVELERDKEALQGQVLERTQLARARLSDNEGLLRELLRAEQQERSRLERLLHDELQQYLVSARMRAAISRDASMAEGEGGEDAQQMVELLDEALLSARSLMTHLKPPSLDEEGLGEAVEQLVERMASLHGLEIALSGAEALPAARVEVGLLIYHAVREGLLNVVKHADTGAAEVSMGLEGEGALVVRVCDGGRGFDVDARPDRDGGLRGLEQRVQAIGGELLIRSSAGEGVELTIRIPEIAGRDASSVEAPPEGALSVLVVDDNDPVRRQLKALLNRADGLSVVGEAATGPDAVREALALRPDLVLMDVSMPGFDGDEATRRLRAAWPEVRVVGVSAFDTPGIEERMRAAGALVTLPKDSEPEEMVARILELSQA